MVAGLREKNPVYCENLVLSWCSPWTAFYCPYSIAVADPETCSESPELAGGAGRHILPFHPCLDDSAFAQKVEQGLAGLGGADSGSFDSLRSLA